ncbi:MAG: membrane protein insertion efficiency factor YidD [Verrucomicrobia bacterium]|nr:membrane protein insertion efficiency factor YidD [Verrucomicrobiota bacterium]
MAQVILLAGLRVYRWVLSPLKAVVFGPLGRCRFTPSCSAYAAEAIREHGAARGSWLALRRLGRCHPWGDCGADPVPPAGQSVGCAGGAGSAQDGRERRGWVWVGGSGGRGRGRGGCG